MVPDNIRKKLWIDLETSGLDRYRHSVLQVAGIVEIDGIIEEEFEFKVRPLPKSAISKKALKVNGFTLRQIKSWQKPRKGLQEFIDICSKYIDPNDRLDRFTMFAYNATFDYQFLRVWTERLNYPYFGMLIWYPPVDILSEAMLYLGDNRPNIKNMRQVTLANYLDIEFDEGLLHDALVDIKLTREIFQLIRGE